MDVKVEFKQPTSPDGQLAWSSLQGRILVLSADGWRGNNPFIILIQMEDAGAALDISR